MVRDFSFRLMYRVVFFSFCLILVCFYRDGNSGGSDRREGKTEPNKFEDEIKGKPLNADVSLEQDERVSSLAKNAKQIGDRKAWNKIVNSKMVTKGTAIKTLRSERIQKSPVLNSSISSPSAVNLPRKESTTIFLLNKTELENDSSKNVPSLKNQIFNKSDLREIVNRETFVSIITQHLRNRRQIDAILESPTECANSTYTIKYENNFRVWNNFTMMYQGRIYYYNDYRVTDDGLQVCNSSDTLVKQRWRDLIVREKEVLPFKYCNVSVDAFYYSNYTLYRNFTVFFKPTEQSFTRHDYGVTFGYFSICSAKLSLSCNDYLVKVKYDHQYNVLQNFSLFYNNKMYDYREYQFGNDGLEICASNDSRILAIWRTRNSWEKFKVRYECRRSAKKIYARNYVVDKQFTVYLAPRSQYFTRNDYGVNDGYLIICQENFKPISRKYTLEDLSMCNDSIINMKYDEEYRVRADFSIFYENKVYDYTEYRVLNDGIKICNSTDNYVNNIWKLRNDWVKKQMHRKSCLKPINAVRFVQNYYTVNKQFTVYLARRSQHFTRNDYGVNGGRLYICQEKLKRISTEYSQEDLLMCNDSIINIRYDDEYKVRTDFSILHKNKVYNYTEYRVLNNGVKICNSTDNYIRNIWKMRNDWVREQIHQKSCRKLIRAARFAQNDYTANRPKLIVQNYYTVNKQFTVYLARRSQYFTRNDYGVKDSRLYICQEKLKRISRKYTQEDLLMCKDSIIKIKYHEEYKVWTNFSILCNNKLYDYTDYRVLNDGIKICNSTDNYVRNVWKVRNKWVKEQMHRKSCSKPIKTFWFYQKYYTVNKQFTVYLAPRSQYFTRNDYGVDGRLIICQEKIKPTSGEYSQEDLLMCNDSIINIKYDDEYNVRTDFSLLYKNKVYGYTEYRVLNDGVKICNSTENYVRDMWKLRNHWVKEQMHQKSCSKPIKTFWFDQKYYTVNKQFTVYLAPWSQYFTRNDYGVDGRLIICQEKIKPTSGEYSQEDLLMCNDSIINIKYDDGYNVRTDFSLLYKNKVYDYTEYRVLNDGVKICNSTENYVRDMWKLRNHWVKEQMHKKSCNKPITTFWFHRKNYTVNKQFSVYSAYRGQYITRNDYGVNDSGLYVCQEKLKPISTEYTHDDLLICNDSIINIKYDDEYKVRTDFSILYKNKMYDYTKYRVQNDGIKICNSTDNSVKNVWELRNIWVKKKIHRKSCNTPIKTVWLYPKYYTVSKQFTVYLTSSSQYFGKNDYGVNGGLYICQENLKPISTVYTQNDLLICKDSIINIKYGDKYKVWSNFSILYKNKVYDYTEYRVLNDSIKICNSTDNFVRNIWKLRNGWVKEKIHTAIKTVCLYPKYFTVSKLFTVYLGRNGQYFIIDDYGVKDGKPCICDEKFKPKSTEYTQDDLLMCNDSIINIKYDDEYKVRTDFSILYKNKVYDYTEYRVLNDSIKICNSTDNYVRNIWKVRNKWVKAKMHYKGCKKPSAEYLVYRKYYTVTKHFTVYLAPMGQYFTGNEYGVTDSRLTISEEIERPMSLEYTQEDLLMCSDSIISIQYDDEHRVRTDFSILYRNKVYDYTEYRVLNDSVKICNSTDADVRNMWKLRNEWVKTRKPQKRCDKRTKRIQFERSEYIVLKNFNVLILATKKLITKYNYTVFKDKIITCVTECTNFTFTVKYEDKYQVWNNFSMMYQGRMYPYDEYRITEDGLQVCNSSDRRTKEQWRNFIVSEKITIAFKHCNVFVDGFYFKNYTVHTNFTVFFKPTNQNFTRHDYGVILGYFVICSSKLRLSCNDDLVKVKFGEQYNVFRNFSLVYNNKMYDHRKYRLDNDSFEICGSNNSRIQAMWRTRNSWQKSLLATCYRSYKLNARYYTVTKKFGVYSADKGQYFKRNDYAVIDGKPYVCGKEKPRQIYVITNFKIIIAPLCALAVSIISLLLLLIVYCMLPELRTLPGLNLMSFSFALLLWQTYLAIFLSLYSRVGKLFEISCVSLFLANKFMTYSIIMNAAVNIYHLRKTFCGNTLVKSDEQKKWNKFLKYAFFSWGVPVIITIVYIVLLNEGILRFDQQNASLRRDVSRNLRLYQRLVFANGDATANEINIYQSITFNFRRRQNKSTVCWKDDAREHDGRMVFLKEYIQPELKFDQRTVEDDANIHQPFLSLKKDVQSNVKFYERIVFANGDGSEDDARIYQQITGDCVNGRVTPDWSANVDVYGFQACLLLYIFTIFIFTAYRIRQKLNASRNITQKSNVVKRRKFVMLLKLSTTTALSYWFPLFISRLVGFDFEIKIALYTVTLLTGAYIGIAFVFTRRNYQLLKKKYFPAKTGKPPSNEIPLNRL